MHDAELTRSRGYTYRRLRKMLGILLFWVGLSTLPMSASITYARPPAVDCSSLNVAFKQAQYKSKMRYRQSRKLLFTKLAPQLGEGEVTALYTGRRTPARKRKAPHGFNCEHVFPRAWMDRKNSRTFKHQEADLHNLFPSEIEVNSRRGHLPFGVVGQIMSYRIGLDSKIGEDEQGEIVIEPRPQVRGDIARALLYMAIRWGKPLRNRQDLGVLKKWSKLDPPSQREERRDELIYGLQGNRNPFVSCPQLIDEAVQRLGSASGVVSMSSVKSGAGSSTTDGDQTLAYSWLKGQRHRIASDQTLEMRISTPAGARRIAVKANSFGAWLRSIPLLPRGAPVKLYNQSLKPNQGVHHAVIDIDVGHRDRQQCADAVIRFRAEYLFSRQEKRLSPKVPIQFNYTTGDKIPYSRWRRGDRPKVEEYLRKGKKRWRVKWRNKRARSDKSYRQFRRYLDNIFSYAGTASLSAELPRRPLHDLHIGDLYLRGGFPGHAVIVIDLAEHPKHGLIMLLAQSYMPAQSPHILKNLESPQLSPWFKVPRQGQLITPEWTFSSTNLYRFKGRDQD